MSSLPGCVCVRVTLQKVTEALVGKKAMVMPESIFNVSTCVVQDWLGLNSNKLSPEHNWIGNGAGCTITNR